MKKKRVIVLMHQDLVPPDDVSGLDQKRLDLVKTERNVVDGLKGLGHEVHKLGLRDELAPLRQAIQDGSPHVVFNLLEEFHGEPVYDHAVVSYLDLMRTPYTGCNPRGLVLARDKALSKKILHYHRIRVPQFAVIPLGRKFRRAKRLPFPLIVKSLVEESSMGISQASVVQSDEKLEERVRFIHEKVGTDVIVEQYIEGRELYSAVMGNSRLVVLPTWEILFEKIPPDAVRIATRRVKWDPEIQKRWGIFIEQAGDLSEATKRRIQKVSKRIYRLLELSGYARIDFRLDSEGELYFLEANPNPEISADSEFAGAAEAAGIGYEQMLQKMLSLGLQRSRR
jgi:D-alanine-D-alanine ligase